MTFGVVAPVAESLVGNGGFTGGVAAGADSRGARAGERAFSTAFSTPVGAALDAARASAASVGDLATGDSGVRSIGALGVTTPSAPIPVSYTHLTLPTIYSV